MPHPPAPSTPDSRGSTRSARRLVVAIDGPSGAGKSTVARLLAERLGAHYLDTGSMYRAITLRALEEGLDVSDAGALAAMAAHVRLEPGLDPTHPLIRADGRDVTAEVRSDEVTRSVSAVSAVPEVRARLVAIQRAAIQDCTAIVVEGRDIGTVVAPDADVKVFLTAAPEARASRRNLELRSRVDEQATAADLARRDALDSTRAVSPLKPAADAVKVDTTDISAAEAVEQIVRTVRAATGGWPA